MFFQKFKTPGVAHMSYLIGDEGEAALIDPRRDVAEYISVAQENKLAIKYVLETHRQEDFVIGSSSLVKLAGAKVVTSEHPLFGHSDIRLADGEEVSVGGLKLRALYTPGHTPESTCYAVFVADAPKHALGVFSGDTLFIGETGRTDLTDPLKTGEHAGVLFDSIHAKLLPLGDQVILWPAHGSGSVCGGNIAERDDSSIGVERAYNPVFTQTRSAFIEAKLRERIPRPPYFKHMENVNLKGGLPAGDGSDAIALLSAKKFAAEIKQGLVIDTRDPEAFAGGHIPNSVNIWLKGLPVFGGWFATASTRVYLVLRDMSELEKAVTHLERIGIDSVAAALVGGFEAWRDAGLPLAYSETIDPKQLQKQLATTTVLDVREDSEFEDEGHIEEAHHLYLGYLDKHLDRIKAELQKKPNLVVACSVGHRAGVAVSLLERRGILNAKNLLGGMTAWQKLDLPLKNNREHTITTPEIEGERA
jgi:hydroxyacylglutathione hydrolase